MIDVDLGNSRIKWRFREASSGEALQQVFHFDFGETLPSTWLHCKSPKIRASSVLSPEQNRQFAELVRTQMGCEVEFAKVSTPFQGLSLAYADPHSLGVDRWLAMLAARAISAGKNLVVISAGTAWTADLIDTQGNHLGGYIIPGVGLAAKSLALHTQGLKIATHANGEQQLPGRTTLECINAGLRLQFAGFITELAAQAAAIFDSPRWMITGGDADFVAKLWHHNGFENFNVIPGLVLDGLAQALP
jgi:type III pantothenate kinase